MNNKLFLIILVIAAMTLAGCASNEIQEETSTIRISTTLFPLYEFAQIVGGEHVEASMLLPAGAEPHSYEPKPSDILAVQKADMFIYIGEEMEPWAHDLLEGVNNPTLTIIEAVDFVEVISGDEHDHDEEHDHEEGHAFEWAGLFSLEEGNYTWTFAKVDGEYADASMKMVILETDDTDAHGIEHVEEQAEELMESTNTEEKIPGSTVIPREMAYVLNFEENSDESSFTIRIEKAGNYVFFTEHMPFEFEDHEHFFKDNEGNDIEPLAQEPETGQDHDHEEEGHDHDHAYDPHVWLSFHNDILIVEEIAKQLSEIDPKNAAEYKNNAATYIEKLEALDENYKTALANCEKNEFISGGHNIFAYLEHEYDIHSIQAIDNLEPNTEPTPARMKEISDIVTEHDLKYVLTEVLVSARMAEAISEETGAQILTFNPAPNLAKKDFDAKTSFISIMESNLDTLSIALECN